MSTPEVKILSEEEIDKRRDRRQHRLDQYFIPNRANTMVHYAEGLYRDLIKETEEAEATIRELQKQLAIKDATIPYVQTLTTTSAANITPAKCHKCGRHFTQLPPGSILIGNTSYPGGPDPKWHCHPNCETNGNTEGPK